MQLLSAPIIYPVAKARTHITESLALAAQNTYLRGNKDQQTFASTRKGGYSHGARSIVPDSQGECSVWCYTCKGVVREGFAVRMLPFRSVSMRLCY